MAHDDVFPVIAERNRRRILEALRPGDQSVGELVDALGVSQPTVSKHLKVLREAGLVTTRADGQRRFYSVDPVPLAEAAAWLTDFATAADSADAVPERAAGSGSDGRPLTPRDPAPPRALVPASSVPTAPVPTAAVPAGPSRPMPSRPSAQPAAAGADLAPAARQPVPPAGVLPTAQTAQQSAQQLGRTVGRTVEQVTGRAQDLLDRLPKPKFGRRR